MTGSRSPGEAGQRKILSICRTGCGRHIRRSTGLSPRHLNRIYRCRTPCALRPFPDAKQRYDLESILQKDVASGRRLDGDVAGDAVEFIPDAFGEGDTL